MIIDLPRTPDARYLFTVGDASYLIERGTGAECITVPVSAYRAGARAVQPGAEEIRVARVTHADPDGRPLTWTWLSAEEARDVVVSAEVAS